ncbi:MAG: Ribonucleotide reductase of class II (coenzyme B12-dependent), partial [uncultured Solirubrobacterales bacterium]
AQPHHRRHHHPPHRSGCSGRAEVHRGGHPSLRRGRLGDPRRGHRRPRQAGVRAARRRVPGELVAERDQHRHPEVLPRSARLARARALGQADDRPRHRTDRRDGPSGRVLRLGRGRRGLRGRAHARAAPPDGGLQLAGVVQRRLEGAGRGAVLGLLHPLRRG